MKKLLLIYIILVVGFTNNSKACTIIAVGKKATVDGSIIISHTDTGPDSRIFVVPAQKYKPGEMAPVYWGIQDADRPLNDDGIILGYIPQVEQTYKYFQSAYSHINEYQLGIGESTTTQRKELTCTRENGKQIMTIEQAQIFTLQRYKKAREAVQRCRRKGMAGLQKEIDGRGKTDNRFPSAASGRSGSQRCCRKDRDTRPL